jgi:CheY-like chemotaxis protein
VSRILLVADEGGGREKLATAIATGPHTVKTLSPSDLRIEGVRDWQPDVIVMDLATDSSALPQRIAMLRDPELSGVPFVAIGESEDEARALGAHGFVRQPAHVESLLGLIGRFAALRFPLPA